LLNGIAIEVVFSLLFPIPSPLTRQWQEGLQLDYTADETNSCIVDIILYNMKTKHFLTGTFSMALIVLISNACLAFAVIHTSIQYNAGYTAACNDSKHMFIWDNDGSIWDGFDQK
jgi:hypothetical protein